MIMTIQALDYCTSDVLLLAEGCIRFSSSFYENASVYPLHETVSAASAALMAFRRKHMPEKTVLADKESNLEKRQSVLARKYLRWRQKQEPDTHYQTIESEEGEYQVGITCFYHRLHSYRYG